MTATLSSIERAAWDRAAEMFKPQPEVDVFGLIEYEPTPKQAEFHAATEFSVLFGGSAGGGKSRAVTAHALRECIRYPGIRVGAFRRTYGELKESLLAELSQLGFGQALGARWNGTEYELRFPNGSLIMFRYAENMTDATRRQGGQYQLLIFDEQTLMSPDVVKFLESRLRSGRKDLPVLGVRATANPGGVGHGAVRDRYIDATDYGENVVTDVRGRTVRFIPSKLSDNPHVNPEYAMDLMALDGQQRAAFLDGNWDAFAGAMFPNLSRDRHVVDPVELPSSWKRYNGIDWGFTAQWAVLWAAVDEDGRVWIYREIYRKQVGEADQATQILAAETDDERVLVRFADDAMWATRGDAKPIADVYADNGVYLTKAGKGPGSRVQGWQRWRTFLADGPACAHHRAHGWETCPKLHMFSTCVDTFKELRDLPHAVTGDPEDADPRAPDHLCLAAGTLVDTRRGDIPIERVIAGDEVMTRSGWRAVEAAGLTAIDQPIVSVKMSDGRTITGTPNHPVWVVGKGWTNLDALRYADRIASWRNRSRSYSTVSPIGVTQSRSVAATASTLPPVEPTANGASGASTRKYGKPQTGQSRMGIMSTIGTKTHSTTTSTTSPACPESITSRSITPTAGASRRHNWLERAAKRWLRLPSGIAATSAENGTGNTPPNRDLGPSLLSHSPASNAESRDSRETAPRTTAFAQTTASRLGAAPVGSTTKTASARGVEPTSGSTNTSGRIGAAHASVLGRRDAGRADVYNLTVADAPEFYANGFLVHNCDAGRYLLLNIESAPDADLFPTSRWLYWKPQVAGRVKCAERVWPLEQAWRFGTAYLPQGEDAPGDFAVMCAWARTLDGDLVLLGRVRLPAIDTGIANAFAELARIHDLDTTYVAKKQATEVARLSAQRAGMPMNAIDSDPDRLARALPAAKRVADRKIWLPSGATWAGDWAAEGASFPANRLAGQIEALALAVRVIDTQWAPPPPKPAQASWERKPTEINFLTADLG